jgi:hypothetical protein
MAPDLLGLRPTDLSGRLWAAIWDRLDVALGGFSPTQVRGSQPFGDAPCRSGREN